MKEMHGLMADNVGTADTWGGATLLGVSVSHHLVLFVVLGVGLHC